MSTMPTWNKVRILKVGDRAYLNGFGKGTISSLADAPYVNIKLDKALPAERPKCVSERDLIKLPTVNTYNSVNGQANVCSSCGVKVVDNYLHEKWHEDLFISLCDVRTGIELRSK